MHYCQRCEPAVGLEPTADVAVCSRCGWTEPGRREPLYVVTGASGSGKSAIFAPLAAALPDCVVFDVDWLIDPMKATGSLDWDAFRDAWLSVAHGIAQGRRSTVLLGPLMPEQLVGLPSRRWIGPVHFAVLDCTDEQRRARLDARPSWREHAIGEHLAFAAQLRRTISTVLHTRQIRPLNTSPNG
ncbi:hypothetical protein Cme02nite_27620 [Catellatospora methionotrophica]|uniref:Uncharacterized protein n=1 Tax=Catellatospora methionotrophica TaxID=121620 RepID=A0A8J3LKK2_9ACTN|nr:hypothetical protein [Catellatospora methionotrophica]GIG14430.1 hypothetical protein Cme02nite_27620 [Catellatospora methionotrophica]